MLRVLLVEDFRPIRALVAAELEGSDCEIVAEAGTGAEALAAARQHAPDVVVMDYRLPDFNGDEVTRQIVEERPETYVIGFIGYEGDIAALHEAGCRKVFLKEQLDDMIAFLKEHAAA